MMEGTPVGADENGICVGDDEGGGGGCGGEGID